MVGWYRGQDKKKAARKGGPNRLQVVVHLPVLDIRMHGSPLMLLEPTGAAPESDDILSWPRTLTRPPPRF
jgi:hypothetical protein